MSNKNPIKFLDEPHRDKILDAIREHGYPTGTISYSQVSGRRPHLPPKFLRVEEVTEVTDGYKWLTDTPEESRLNRAQQVSKVYLEYVNLGQAKNVTIAIQVLRDGTIFFDTHIDFQSWLKFVVSMVKKGRASFGEAIVRGLTKKQAVDIKTYVELVYEDSLEATMTLYRAYKVRVSQKGKL